MTGITRSQFLAGLGGAGAATALGLSWMRGRPEDGGTTPAGADRTRLTPEDRARLVDYFPNVTLVTHHGREVRFYDDLVRGKFVVFSLMYTVCERLCPLTTANLIAAKKALGDRVGRDVFFYGLTLDPARDSPRALSAYARRWGSGEGYVFLTGTPRDISLVRRKLGLFDPDPIVDADKSSHGALAVYGNEPAGLWGGVPALIRPERIVHRLRRALAA
jgi:protein SCO1/2